ncbi:MAG TPA: 3-deoxy-8-phosphooctulonate synthase [Candidatus Manganitrophaceae bacterium]|nr:3-deoxy-8-phosphooctulonate synthase [Candidatus Manganitrophaceae bacterium]
MAPQSIEIGKIKLGKGAFFLIAGPCVIESEDLVLKTADQIARIAASHRLPFIFKSSYDKANRSAVSSYRGIGMEEGLRILQKVKSEIGVPALSDVHAPEEAAAAAEVLDVLQIPAFLCRQTDLLLAAGRTGKAVNVKKGQFLAPWDMVNVVEKLESTGNKNILLTERGASFGYNNLVSDMRSLVIMRRTGYPVVFDGTHSVQLPGGGGKVSSGQREFVAPLSRAAVAAGCDGLFLEVHPHPDQAPSDGPNMIDFSELNKLLTQVKRILEALEEREG